MRRVIVTLALAALVVVLWPARFGGSTTWLVVRGPSMRPTFRSGDLTVVRAASRYRIGDIVLARVPGGYVVHRVVGVDQGSLVLRGDANAHDDAFRPHRSDVVGRVVVGFGRWPLELLGFAPFVGAAVTGLAVTSWLWPRQLRGT